MFDLQQIKGAGFEEVLRQMPAAVVIAEAPSGKILFSNREAQRWTEQVLGQRVPQELGQYRDLQDSSNFQMFHPDGRPYEVEEWPLTRSIRDGEEVRGEEIVHRLADGTRQWSRYDSFPIYDDEVRIVAGVLIAHDVTDEKLSLQRAGSMNCSPATACSSTRGSGARGCVLGRARTRGSRETHSMLSDASSSGRKRNPTSTCLS